MRFTQLDVRFTQSNNKKANNIQMYSMLLLSTNRNKNKIFGDKIAKRLGLLRNGISKIYTTTNICLYIQFLYNKAGIGVANINHHM